MYPYHVLIDVCRDGRRGKVHHEIWTEFNVVVVVVIA